MGTKIHPTAVIEAGAELDDGVEIGPFCCVGPAAQLASDVVLRSHVVLDGKTTLGRGTEIYPFASIGLRPQDLKYKGEASKLIVGDECTIREYVTMNPGTEGGGMVTRTGNGCLFMAGAHVAHDCRLGDNVIMANNATLGGHVVVEDFAFIGGLAAVQQFVRVGAHAMIGGMVGVKNDVVPFALVMGERGRISGVNVVGMKRRGFSRDQVNNLRSAYRLLFDESGNATMADRLDRIAERYDGATEVMDLVRFIRTDLSRGLTPPKDGNGG